MDIRVHQDSQPEKVIRFSIRGKADENAIELVMVNKDGIPLSNGVVCTLSEDGLRREENCLPLREARMADERDRIKLDE